MFVTAQQLEQQMPDASRLLSDEPEMESSLHYIYDASHQWKPTPAEQVEQERQRAEKLAEYLRNQGIDPENLL